MGEMTIKVDDALMGDLSALAAKRGLGLDDLAAQLLRSALRAEPAGRAAGARAILAAQPRLADHDSVDLLREDRAR